VAALRCIFIDTVTMRTNILWVASGWLLAAAFGAASAQTSGEYASDLGTLYGERYWIQAYKDVCISALPKSRREFQRAYDEWMGRHEDVIENLESRFAVMIKGISRDNAEYTRNYNEYHGAVMRQREEDKNSLRKLPREDLIKRCKGLPAYLRSADSDMYNTHPKEFDAIYGKNKP